MALAGSKDSVAYIPLCHEGIYVSSGGECNFGVNCEKLSSHFLIDMQFLGREKTAILNQLHTQSHMLTRTIKIYYMLLIQINEHCQYLSILIQKKTNNQIGNSYLVLHNEIYMHILGYISDSTDILIDIHAYVFVYLKTSFLTVFSEQALIRNVNADPDKSNDVIVL